MRCLLPIAIAFFFRRPKKRCFVLLSCNAGSSGESQSEDEEEDSPLSSSAAGGGWGRGGVRSRSRGGSLSRQGGGTVGRRGRSGGDLVSSSSLANRYEDDEEACFTRVKELWHERVSVSLYCLLLGAGDRLCETFPHVVG